MAARRTNRKNTSKGSQAIVVFWLVFVIVIVIVFMVNYETIQKNFNLFTTRLTTSPGAEEELLMLDDDPVNEPFIEVTIAPPGTTEQP
ncbi:MAG: hypothetical protein FWD24_05785, partial [Treponema sp.]|nr:hypothetical protein [Treponema sp.]